MRTVYRENILRELKYISDYERQKIDWFGEQSWWSSFGEEACMLFDDTVLGENLNDGIEIFNPEIDSILKELSFVIDVMDEYLPPEVILESEEMKKVRFLASKAAGMIEASGLTINNVRKDWK